MPVYGFGLATPAHVRHARITTRLADQWFTGLLQVLRLVLLHVRQTAAIPAAPQARPAAASYWRSLWRSTPPLRCTRLHVTPSRLSQMHHMSVNVCVGSLLLSTRGYMTKSHSTLAAALSPSIPILSHTSGAFSHILRFTVLSILHRCRIDTVLYVSETSMTSVQLLPAH